MKTCPNCGKPVAWQDNPHRPFCSERCKLIDFGRWANEEYRVPGEVRDEGEGMKDEQQESEHRSQEIE